MTLSNLFTITHSIYSFSSIPTSCATDIPPQCNMDDYYQNQYGQYPVAPTAYSNDESFITTDLGSYDGYSSYPMDRVTSDFSHSSFDSAVPSDYTSPTTVDDNFDFDSYSATYPSNYYIQQSYSPATSPTSYTTISTQAGIPRNASEYQSPQITQHPIAQPSR